MMKRKVLILIPELEEKHKSLFEEHLGKYCDLYFRLEDVALNDVDALIIFHYDGVINLDLLKKMKNLKIIQSITAGIDHIPVKEIERLCIKVEGAPGANSHFIAEHVFAMILCAIKKICYHTETMRRGGFHQEEMHRTLWGKNMLILGFGSIGQEVAKISRLFNMKIKVFKRNPEIPEDFKNIVEKVYTSKGELFEAWPWADYLVLALPLTEETRSFIGVRELSLMKKDAVLVNVARGKLIDEGAFYKHLKENPDFLACLDTWWVYPEKGRLFRQHFDFQKLKNVVMTPHVAPKVKGYFENMIITASKKLLKSLQEVVLMKELKRYEVKPGKYIVVVQGDITEENVDAIVNAANSHLKHGGGVAGAIVRKGGEIIQKESDAIGYCPVGDAVVTSAGNLKAKYVIHAVGPRWGEGYEEMKLRSAVYSALERATERKLKSISIPAISTGIFGYPKGPGTRVIFDTCVEYLKNKETTLEEVRLCNIDEETCKYYMLYIQELEGSNG